MFGSGVYWSGQKFSFFCWSAAGWVGLGLVLSWSFTLILLALGVVGRGLGLSSSFEVLDRVEV